MDNADKSYLSAKEIATAKGIHQTRVYAVLSQNKANLKTKTMTVDKGKPVTFYQRGDVDRIFSTIKKRKRKYTKRTYKKVITIPMSAPLAETQIVDLPIKETLVAFAFTLIPSSKLRSTLEELMRGDQ